MRTLLIVSFVSSVLWSQSQAPPESPQTAKKGGTEAAQQKAKPAEAQQRPGEAGATGQKEGDSPPTQEHSGDKAAEELQINRRLATFTMWLVIVGAVQIIALLMQARIFWVTLRENRNLIRAASIAANAARDGAAAAVGSNTLTRESNEESRRSNRVSRRAAIHSETGKNIYPSLFVMGGPSCYNRYS